MWAASLPMRPGSLRVAVQMGWMDAGRAQEGQSIPRIDPANGAVALDVAREGITLSAEAGIDAIRTKSIALTAYAIDLADELLAPYGVRVGSPRDPARRGGHVALVHPEAQTLTRALAEEGVIADYRAPDVIRIGLSALTTRFADVHRGLVSLAAQLVQLSATNRLR